MTQHEIAVNPEIPEPARTLEGVVFSLGDVALNANQRQEPSISDLIEHDFLQASAREGINLESVMPQDALTLAQVALKTVDVHAVAKHKAEFAMDKPHADPPPLIKAPFHKLLKQYYDNPKIALRGADRVHDRTLDTLRAQYNLLIEKYRHKLPEIQEVINLQSRLKVEGKTGAADVMSDVLAVYGQVIQGLINQATTARRMKEEAEARRKRFYE